MNSSHLFTFAKNFFRHHSNITIDIVFVVWINLPNVSEMEAKSLSSHLHIFTSRRLSRGKVMFSVGSVCHSCQTYQRWKPNHYFHTCTLLPSAKQSCGKVKLSVGCVCVSFWLFVCSQERSPCDRIGKGPLV